jgi:hypothetical protein
MITELEADQDFVSAFLRGLLEDIETVERIRDGLFEQNGASRLCGRDGNIEVQGSGVRNHNRIGFVLFERFVNIGFKRITREFVIGQCGFARAEEDDIFFAQSDEVTKMTPTDGAKTCD